MKTRYVLRMLSLSIVHLTIAVTFMASRQHFEKLGAAILLNLFWLIGVNAIGAHFIFRPIDRFLRGESAFECALRRIRKLTPLSVAWGITLVVPLSVFSLFVVQVMCPGCESTPLIPFRLAMMSVFAVFCGTYLYFLVGDFEGVLKAEIFTRWEIAVKPTRGRLSHKLLAAFVAVAVVPVSLILLESLVFSAIRPLQGIDPRRAFLFDLFLSALMAGTALYFIQRNLSRPVRTLLTAVEQVTEGNLDAKPPVMTNDEFGILADSVNQMIEGLREREFIRETFGRYVPAEIAKTILSNRGLLLPEHRQATILYSDIEGFTTICENLAPERVVALLNDYFSFMVEILHRHHGVVTQFQGDAILAVFNVPVEDANHAVDAIGAALDIQDGLRSRRFGGGTALPTRIGINSGLVVAGPVGAGRRLNYTVHGDAVNVAARLEQLNKELGTRILIADSTRILAGDAFGFAARGEIRIRGKAETVGVFTTDGETVDDRRVPGRG